MLTLPGGAQVPMGMRSRRETFPSAAHPGGRAGAAAALEVRQGHADRVRQRGGRAAGLQVDGADIVADLVIDASGRAGRVTRSLPPAVTSGGPCGIAYVDRQYQLHPGAEPGPLANPLAWQADLDGYQAIIFVHERGRFSVLLVRPAGDQVLARLRHEAAFTAASRAIPGLADWVDPARARPRPRRCCCPAARCSTPIGPRPGPETATSRCRGWSSCRATPWRHHADRRPGRHHHPAAGPAAAAAHRRARHRRGRRGGELRRLVHRADQAVGRRPRAYGRRHPAPLGRAGHRPAPAAALRPPPGRRRGRARPGAGHLRLPGHDRAARLAARHRAPGPRAVHASELAPARPARPQP